MHWPQKVTMKSPSGSVTFEAHAEWCPVEHARATMGASSTLVAFAAELAPQCECVPSYRLNGVRIGCFPPMKPVVFDGP